MQDGGTAVLAVAASSPLSLRSISSKSSPPRKRGSRACPWLEQEATAAA